MKTTTLLQHIALYSVIARFRFKREIPANAGIPVLVNFGLWGCWYVVKSFGRLICKDGREMPFHEMRTHAGEIVIGQRDMAAADGTSHAEAWRESFKAAISERLNLAGDTLETFRCPGAYSKRLRDWAAKKKTTKTAIILLALEKLMHPKK